MFLGLYRKGICLMSMTVMGLVTSSTRLFTGGRGVNFNRTVVAPLFCRATLLLIGVRIANLIDKPLGDGVACYFFNHNSILDIFLIPALGLTNTRFIITEGVKRILPLHLCNLGIDVLYIPDTHKTAERIEFFKGVSADLEAGRYNVICSPEGRHDWDHGIAPFNRGVFHMAMVAKCPIHALFFNIPKAANPLEGTVMRNCTVEVRTVDLIPTEAWKLGELPQHIQAVREKFIAAYLETHGDLGGFRA